MKITSSAYICFVVYVLCFVPIAQANEVMTGSSVGSYSWEAIKVALSLAVVLTIFYIFVYIFKKYMGGPLKSNSSIRMLGGISVGSKEKIVIVEAGKVNLLVGVSGYGITKLHQFTEDELEASQENDQSMMSFGQHIEKIIRKNNE